MVCHQVLQSLQHYSPLAMVRMQGYTVAIYIDDIIPIDQSFEASPYCGRNNKFVSKTELCNTSM